MLLVFVVVSCYYRDSYWFELGVTLFSIALVYLVMVTSNIELKETTEKQVKAFVENLQKVNTQLENVSNGISTLTSVMKDVQEAIEKSTLTSELALAKREEEKRKRKESIKPQLLLKIEVKGFPGIFGFLDMRHYFLTIWNSGSDAIGTIVQIGNKISQAYDIRTRTQQDIDFGHISEFRGVSAVNVQIEVRDVDRNLYSGNIQTPIPQPQWISVPLTEA